MLNDLIWGLLYVFLAVANVNANVEKTIFLGPVALRIPAQSSTISDLELPRLSPTNPVLRKNITARFPGSHDDKGETSWLLLQGLEFQKRYEVRVCWAATQPTNFHLDTYELSEVVNSPMLSESLAQYMSRNDPSNDFHKSLPSIAQAIQKPGHDITGLQSLLLLRVSAAADYYTSNKELMENVPLVLVDLILDPFTFGLLPKSLEKTAVYLVILVVVSWNVSKLIAKWLSMISNYDDREKDD